MVEEFKIHVKVLSSNHKYNIFFKTPLVKNPINNLVVGGVYFI